MKVGGSMATGTIPVPAPAIDESPTISVCINKDWAHTLIGQIWGLRYPEAWGGTLEENRRARAEIKNLIDMLMREDECEMAICCEPQIYIYRINTDTGRMERSSDGGTVWTPDPSDPLHAIVQQPAPVRDGSSKVKCDAATDFSTHFNDIITGCSENLGTATTVVELAGGIAALLLDIFIIVVTGGAGIAIVTTITGLIFAGISAAFAEGKAAFDAYWTSDNKAAVVCAAFCTMRDDGTWDQVGWENFKHKLRLAIPPGAALDMVLTSVNAGGYVGANNMASYGIAADSDCSECLCNGACSPDAWHLGALNSGIYVAPPTVLSSGSDFWELQSVDRGDGQQYVYITSNSDDQCCNLVVDVLTGDPTLTVGIACGTSREAANFVPLGLTPPNNLNAYGLGSSGVFTCKITFHPVP